MSSDSRQDARAIAAAIASHAAAIEGYALDPSVTDEVFEHEMLGRAHLIEARLGRLRAATPMSRRKDAAMARWVTAFVNGPTDDEEAA